MPLSIQAEHFRNYPPEAKRLATSHLLLLRELPAAFTPLLLQQVEAYDWRFPAERREIDRQLGFLEAVSPRDRRRLFAGFENLQLPARLTDARWAGSPEEFSEQLANYLWSTRQIDAYHEASSNYLKAVNATITPSQPLSMRRLGIAVIGKDVDHNSYPLFRKLRSHGTHFTNVSPANGLAILLDHVANRAAAQPSPFDHWYVDGGSAEPVIGSGVDVLAYNGIELNRQVLLHKINGATHTGIGGPEALLVLLHRLRPEEIGFKARTAHEAVVSHFATALLTAGSGTQIFSTSFVQWATRELWRRAQPLTILARFAPRRRQRPMNEMFAGDDETIQLDVSGSLIDADMGAFYMWLDQQRLSGAADASFLIWFENHPDAFVISPTLPSNTESNSAVDMKWLLSQVA